MSTLNISRSAVAALCALLLGAPAVGYAQDTAGAARAYSQAHLAETAGNPAQAAELYELAYSLAPAAAALRAAVRTHRQAGHPATAASLAQRLREQYDDEESGALAEETITALAPELMRVVVECNAPCVPSLDGFAVATDPQTRHTFFATAGEHAITSRFADGRTVDSEAAGEAGGGVTVTVEEPAPDPEPVAEAEPEAPDESLAPAPAPAASEDDGGGGVTPVLFIVGAIAAVGLGAVTVWSGLDTLELRDEYDAMPSRELHEQGLGRELRTNILIAGSATFAAATLIVAFFTDWGGDDAETDDSSVEVALGPGPGDAGFALVGSF